MVQDQDANSVSIGTTLSPVASVPGQSKATNLGGGALQSSPAQNYSPVPSSTYTISSNSIPRMNVPVLPDYSGGPGDAEIITGNNTTEDSNRNAAQAVLLGIETLERQQAELEMKRQRMAQHVHRENPFDTADVISGTSINESTFSRPQDHTGVPMTVHLTGAQDDDLTTVSGSKNAHSSVTIKKHNRINSFGKLLKTPLKPIRRTFSDRFNVDPAPSKMPSEQRMKPIIFGYLHKLGRNNKWQKRWFESDGTGLKYFKSKKKEKCLATLDLLRVGTIAMDRTDAAGCTFTIEVAGRQYYLCADTKERAMDWVITLNRVREARAQIGGLKLINPEFMSQGNKPVMARRGSDSDDENVAPRVVMNTSRPRTKGIGKEDFSDMEKSIEDEERPADVQHMMTSTTLSPSAAGSLGSSSPRHAFLHPQLMFLPHSVQNQVSVRWTKQRSSVQNWVRRLSRWAKRMTMVRCVVKDDVVHLNHMQQRRLDMHMHGEEESTYDHGYGTDQPFIDLDIARYSNCPESYGEGQVSDASTAQQKFRFVDNANASSSWKAHKPDQASAGSSIQSSSGRMSPNIAEDDSSGIIA